MTKPHLGIALTLLGALVISLTSQPRARAAEPDALSPPSWVYLPLVFGSSPPPFACPTSSANSYASGTAHPVRPGQPGASGPDPCRQEPGSARVHAEHGRGDCAASSSTTAPVTRSCRRNSATLFQPARVPPLSGFSPRARLELEPVPRAGHAGCAADDLAGNRAGVAGDTRRGAARAGVRLRYRPGL